MIHIKLSLPKLCLLLSFQSSFYKKIFRLLSKFSRRKMNKLCKFVDAAQVILHVTYNLTILPDLTVVASKLQGNNKYQ